MNDILRTFLLFHHHEYLNGILLLTIMKMSVILNQNKSTLGCENLNN